MLEKLKCCPHCGNTQIDYWDEADGFFYCEPCGLCGPRAKDKDKAINKWNSLPRKLKWTKEKPTEPGIYFYRKNINALFTVIGVYEDKDMALCYVMLGSKKIKLIEYLQGEFAGPIPEPED